jgi:SAM-dependent methyltransferase
MKRDAFDAAAHDYDRSFTDRQPGRWYRDLVWEELGAAFGTGDRVLDLGCGTGEDAVWLARRGIHVTALDVSGEMLAVARQKAEAAGVTERVSFVRRDLAAWDPAGDECDRLHDGALANFGALNCIADLEKFAGRLAGCLRPDALAALVIMGPICPWEIVWYAARGRLPTALRRLRRSTPARVADGVTVETSYPSPRRVASAFAPHFERIRLIGIGSLLPPPYLSDLVERGEAFFRRVAWLDRRAGRCFPWNWLADHYLIMLRRTPSPRIDA